MAEWFRAARGARKQLEWRRSGGRTEGGDVALGGGVVNAVGGAVRESADGAPAGTWRAAC
jgi:hypothetical protein